MNEDWMQGASALNGSPRIIDFGDDGSAIVDIGAYEAREYVPPQITLDGDDHIILECGTPYVEQGYTATDNYDGDITDRVVVTGRADLSSPGNHVLKYDVKDSSGNAAEQKVRQVEIRDTIAPVIVLLGDNPMTLELGTPYVEPGYTATDSCDGDLTDKVVVTGLDDLDHNVVGSYILRYTVLDWSWNLTEETRTVNVEETVPFIITEIVVAAGIQLTWNSGPDDTYTIQSCTDLSAGEWNDDETIGSEGDLTTWTDSNTSSPQKFYRIGIE